MRLLAYGGTGYYERQRIGDWDNAPRDALDDSFRLEEKRLTFGLGLIDQTPVLVVRRLQVTRTGRAYAYSLLLDPGQQVWERFGWDAAALTSALFAESFEIGRLLLEQPENLNKQQLEDVFGSLQPETDPQTDRFLSSMNDSQSAWIGALLINAASSWPPRVFGFVERPEARQISVLLGSLPPCFRAGRGWLIGGSGQTARSFGAQFCVDERSDTEAATAEMVQSGRDLWEALQSLALDDQFAELAMSLLQQPMWQWPNADADPAAIAKRLKLITQLLKPSPQDDSLRLAIETLAETEFLQIELRRAWQRAAVVGRRRHSPGETSFALENYFDHGLPLNSEALLLMEADTVAKRFVAEGLEPANPDTPNLPASIRYKVWTELLRQSAYEDVPGIFFRAFEDVLAEDREQAATLVQEVRARMISEKSHNLLAWHRYLANSHWTVAKPVLCEQARERAAAHEPGWPLDYLLFAEDEGADWLIGQPTSKTDWKDMVKLLVSLVQHNHAYAEPARRWLQALAGSGIRTMPVLSHQEKLLISETVRGDWISYMDLVEAYCNQVEFFRPTRQLDDSARRILRKELEFLIEEKPARDFAPDLGGIESLLGPLSGKTLTYFQDLEPEFSKPSDATKWVQALGARDPTRASRATVRYLLTNDGAADTDYWLKSEFEEKELEKLFTPLLFRDHPSRGKRYQKRLKELLLKAQAHRAKRIFRLVNRLFKEGIENDEQARIFCKRFGEDRETLEILFSFLPRTSSGLYLTDALSQHSETYFVNEAFKIWQLVVRKVRTLDPYQYALMYHLSKRKGQRVQVKRKLEELFPGELIDLKLDEILQRGVNAETISDQLELPAGAGESVTEHEPPPQPLVYEAEETGIWTRFKSFLGFGHARQSRGKDEADKE